MTEKKAESKINCLVLRKLCIDVNGVDTVFNQGDEVKIARTLAKRFQKAKVIEPIL